MSPEKPPPFRSKLSDAFIRSLTPSGKYADGDVPGLYLQVRASLKPGKSPSRHWRLKYRLRGKENVFVIGRYPDVGLKEARELARTARNSVTNHIDPLKAKKAKIEAQWRNEAGEVITLHGVHDPAQKPTDAPLGAPLPEIVRS
ncbi:integrase [Pseudomonas sp. XWY-1]|uniref:Integrase family protein n=1 Tax=Pseudomonas putida (strain DOT-T1E) TaxID=1196325 RepID=I7CFK9_PSEPT|nr:integrase family protein [Pseudomonas putida DOT-T1E]AUZ59699.1 integrase [Pseudomonas sp. XWY-1]